MKLIRAPATPWIVSLFSPVSFLHCAAIGRRQVPSVAHVLLWKRSSTTGSSVPMVFQVHLDWRSELIDLNYGVAFQVPHVLWTAH